MRRIQIAIVLLLALLPCAARGGDSLFDPSRHMRVAEVKPGMKGHGLSVFSGTKIDRFNVEVVSILRNFNPKYDVVLIRCSGANLEHSGVIAGMSGSPIFLTDDNGHDRMVGAVAYGWPMVKDPLAGVQPIEYMLEIGSTLKPQPAATQPVGESRTDAKPFRYDPFGAALKGPAALAYPVSPQQLTGTNPPQLQPLATPLMAAGVSPKLMEQFAPLLREYGLVPLQAGGGGAPATQPVKLEPGSVLAAPLLTGDVDLTAIGTCTEVIGDRVFGFGHPFNNEGPITLPMGAGYINAVLPSIVQSVKLGAMTELRGTLIADQMVVLAGRLGASPPSIPIDVRVIYTDGSLDASYHYKAAAHPRLTPILSGMAVLASLSGQRDLPQYHTVDFELTLEFANGKTLKMQNVAANVGAPMMFYQVATPIVLAAENPFERVMVAKVSGTVRITPEAHEAEILSVNLPKMKYHPGETLHAFVRYRPFRGQESILPIELQLPHNLRDGVYQFNICDQQTYLAQEQAARPFRFSAENIDDIFAVLNDFSSIRQDAIYLQLLRQADGVAVGRAAMPLLPSSRREILLDAGRSNVSAFISSAVKIIPTKTVMTGSAQFEIEIDTDARTEARPAQPHAAPKQDAAPAAKEE